MKPAKNLLCIACFLFCFAKCNKDKLDSNGLPKATQDGRNTFGFLLNGEVWTPKGFNGTGNLSAWYDPTLLGGSFNIAAYRYIDGTNSSQNINLYGDSVEGPEKIILPNSRIGVIFVDDLTQCEYHFSDSTFQITGGYLEITKVDKASGIFSGRFEIKIKKAGCGDVQISEGRFDMKL